MSIKIHIPKKCSDRQYEKIAKAIHGGDTIVVYNRKQKERLLDELSKQDPRAIHGFPMKVELVY